MTWDAAVAWAASLTYFGGGWRLPKTRQPDPSCDRQIDPGFGFPLQGWGANCVGGELGYMYYAELGNQVNGGTANNTAPFLNVVSSMYWSSEYAPQATGAWVFSYNSGVQFLSVKTDYPGSYQVAVRDGDVASYPARTGTAIEYYHAGFDHYFITWMPTEITKLDVGNEIRGWVRTGYFFKTYTAAQAGTSPVCRFYIPPVLGDSHFYGRGAAECNATGQNNPSFVLESPDFMHMILPAAGTCPVGATPVYRVFSNRPDANHRYMTDRAVREQMVAKGWLAEGDGPDLVVMCAP
jgi:hypothetical protein